MEKDAANVVQTGYDSIAERYLAWGAGIQDAPRDRFVADFSERLPRGSRILDLGCGAAEPSTSLLARRFEVVGVDLSINQLRAAKERLAGTQFLQADIANLAFREGAFDGIVALYSISHVPRVEHERLFQEVATWLRPAGLFLATLGAVGGDDWYGEWLGVPMFFSSYDATTNRQVLRSAGFDLITDDVIEIHEPEGPVSFLWVLAQKRI